MEWAIGVTAPGTTGITPTDLLSRVLRGESAVWPVHATAADSASVLAASQRHGVGPLLYHCLKAAPEYPQWPAELRDALAKEARMQAAIDLLRERELIAVLAALAAAGVRPLLLKGTPLAYTHYPQPSLRPRCDTDVLIPPAARETTARVLERLNYRRSPVFAGVTYQSAYRKSGYSIDHVLDVHWRINNLQVFAQSLNHADLFDRSVPVPQLGTAARALSPPDTLLLALMHRTAHGKEGEASNRLIWLYDIHLLAQAMTAGEWEEFARLSAAKKMQTICLDGFSCTRQALSTAFPDAMMERLGRLAGKTSMTSLLVGRWHFLLEDLRSLPTWRERALLLWESSVPPAAFMLAKYQTNRRGLLPWLYLRRAMTGVWKFSRR